MGGDSFLRQIVDMTFQELQIAVIGGLVVSAVIALLRFFINALKFSLNRMKKTFLDSNWYGYHYSVATKKPVIKETIWTISRGFTAPYSVKYYLLPENHLYSGSGRIEGKHLLCTLRSKTPGTEEEAYSRIAIPVPPNDKLTYGIWLSFNFDNKVCAGPLILSRDKLSTSKIKSMIATNFSMYESSRNIELT